MQAAGVELLEHVENLSVMGFTEVLKHLRYFNRVMRTTRNTISEQKPVRIILIDYPGFNLRLARKLQNSGIPITYFILPQVWAWKENRIKTIKRYIDQTLCIFPFEEEWFRSHGVEASFTGHPFADSEPASLTRDEFYAKHQLNPDDRLLVLFPGSRQQEIDRHWTAFLGAARLVVKKHVQYKIMLGRAPEVNFDPLPADILVETDEPQLALRYGHGALVASGTATLEAAVFSIPAVVAYRLSSSSYWLAKRMVKLPFVSMVNLIANEPVVPELLQNKMTVERLSDKLELLLENGPEQQKMLAGYQKVKAALGRPGAYSRAAIAITNRSNL